jgi:fatty acid kinase fatty acid binding subunit
MVGVVTDSAANLPDDLVRDLSIEVVPLYLKFGESTYRDGIDLTPSHFYQRLVEGREHASTASPSQGDFLAAYEHTGQSDIVCITVNSTMSSSHQQSTLAAEGFPGRVAFVDSKSASMGEGFVVLEAARMAAIGKALEEVEARANEVAGRTRLFAMVETFEFLRKSGRVTKLQAYAATMLDIKPVFGFKEGEVIPVARSRTRRRALARIIDETLQEAGDRPVHLAVIHAAAEDDARGIQKAIAEQASVVESFVVPVTPVIGAHTGPGLVGTAFYTE